MTEFIVLRDRNAGRRLEETLRIDPSIASATGGSPTEIGPPPRPELTVENLEQSDVHEAERDPGVQAVARTMPIRLIEPMAGTASPTSTPTWGVQAVGADISAADGAGVIVSILDTGIDSNHPAFAGVNITQKDFSGFGNGDPQGHGTHCAGTAFGRDVSGNRIGVARGVSDVLIGKVLGDDGRGRSDWLFNGMNWASEQGAQVISMSLGFDFPGLTEQLIQQGYPPKLASSVALEAYRMNLRVFDSLMNLMAARSAFNGGTVVVAASGNESQRDVHPSFEVSASLPAAARGIVSVGAAKQAGAAGLGVADFSNTNPVMAAPGVDVLSAKSGGGLVAFNGTSMATPHVAGLAALWWQSLRASNIPATADSVRARLRSACDPNAFDPAIDIALRGDGLAKAP